MRVYVQGEALLAYMARKQSWCASDDATANRTAVRRWLARYAEVHECDVVLVWQQNASAEVLPRTEAFGRLKVVNLPFGDDMVAEIAGPANRAAAAERVCVVTEDPKLRDTLGRGRAAVQTPAAFVQRARAVMGADDEEDALEPDEKFRGPSEDEVDFWLSFFDERS
jgi:hypothetical protein